MHHPLPSLAVLLASLSIGLATTCLAQGSKPILPPEPTRPHKSAPPPLPAQIGGAWKQSSVCIQNNYPGYAILIQSAPGGKAQSAGETLQYHEKNYFPSTGTSPFRVSLVGTKVSTVFSFTVGKCYQIYYGNKKMSAAVF